MATRHPVAVLGMGPRGFEHARAVAALPERYELKAVCDLKPERLGAALTELGRIGVHQVRGYSSAKEMLRRERPEVFCFTTPPNLRLPLVETAIAGGVKAVSYEKPMALSLAEAAKIGEVCAHAGVKQVVSHQHKFGVHWQKVRELVASGELGRVHTLHANSKGWYLWYITHLVDGVMFLNDWARGRWVVGHAHGRSKLDADHPSPEYVMGHIGFENGVRGLFECGPLSPGREGRNEFWLNAGVWVYGTEGYAEIVVGSGWRAVTRRRGAISGWGVAFREIEDTTEHYRLLADWLEDESKVHPCRGEIAYHGLELSLAMILSSLEQRTVTVPVDPAIPIVERMCRELPGDPFVGEG